MKLKKGSIEAKRYMAKIRAKRKPVKKLGYSKDRLKIVKETTKEYNKLLKKNPTAKKNRAKSLSIAQLNASIKLRKKYPYVDPYSKKASLGASGDYAKFEIAVIKNLSKLLKKPYKKVLEIVNTDESLLNIISRNFDKNISVSITAKELKAKLITVAKKNPIESFIEILNKLPKKDQVSKGVKFPIKLPATVQIGSILNAEKNIYNLIDQLLNKRSKLKQYIVFNNKLGEHYNFSSIEIKQFKKDIILINKEINQLKKIAVEHSKLNKLKK